MKTEKSSIKKESVEFDIEKIQRFTQTQLEKLANTESEFPFCYQVGSDILVGKNKVIKINDKCWRVVEEGQSTFDFFTRKNAIFYCIALHQRKPQVAEQIRGGDALLSQLEFDAVLFRHRYKKANQSQDGWGIQYYSDRYTETMYRIDQTKKELKKSLNLAKYIKV